MQPLSKVEPFFGYPSHQAQASIELHMVSGDVSGFVSQAEKLKTNLAAQDHTERQQLLKMLADCSDCI